MGVPEAAIYENGHVPAWKDEIRLAREVLAVQAEAQPHSMGCPSDNHLWRGVSGFDLRHRPRTVGWIFRVG